MANHHWPGDIRELQNVIERGVILTSGTVLSSQTTNSLIWRQAKAARVGEAESMSRKTLAEAERAHITAILRESRWVVGGSHGAAARWDCQGQRLSPKCNVWAFPARRREVGGREDSRTPPATNLAEEPAGLHWFDQQQADAVGTLGRSQI